VQVPKKTRKSLVFNIRQAAKVLVLKIK